MRIGIDFDNTIAGYDHVFPTVAKAEGLLEATFNGGKQDVRQTLRERGLDGELMWQRLQGMVYGKYMYSAEIIDGVGEFLKTCRDRSVSVSIVSHKTETGHHDPENINLRDAAKTWMREHGFFDPTCYAIDEKNVYFESTRDEKIARIAMLECTHFIDDLEEVLLEPGFPVAVTRILFSPTAHDGETRPFSVTRSWQEIEKAIFDDPLT